MSEHLFDLFRLELLADLAPEYLLMVAPFMFNTSSIWPVCYPDIKPFIFSDIIAYRAF